MESIRRFIGAKEGDILLAEVHIDLGKLVKRAQFSRIGLNQPNMGHRAREFLLPFSLVQDLALLHPIKSSSAVSVPFITPVPAPGGQGAFDFSPPQSDCSVFVLNHNMADGWVS